MLLSITGPRQSLHLLEDANLPQTFYELHLAQQPPTLDLIL